MAKKRIFAERVLAEGEIQASLLSAWISCADRKQVPLALTEKDLQAFYHKKARLVLEVLL